MEKGKLYIVATPIGNLSDMTYRAVETLKTVNLIVCEDTRTSQKLLDHFEISTQTMSFYQNFKKGNSIKPVPKLDLIIGEIRSGKNLALITDAGTPGISDPGNQLVERAIEENISVIPIPGASSLMALISICGVDMREFTFFGFPPHKKGRETFFKKIKSSEFPAAYFESPHRLLKNLELLESLKTEKSIIIGRELTKMFEETVRGNASEVLEYFKNNPEKVKGEIVVIIH